MVDVAAGIAALTASIGLAKELRIIDKNLSEADFKLKIADLTSTLADAKVSLVDARDEIDKLNSQIAELKAQWATRTETIEVDGYRMDERDGQPVGRPYCPRCDTVDNRLIRLVPHYSPGRPLQCPQCKHDYFNAPEYG